MKKYFLFLIVALCVLSFSCSGGGGGDDDHGPMIANLQILADPADLIETTTFNVGDIFYVAFEAGDEDKDIKYVILQVVNTTTSETTTPETEMELPKQDGVVMRYFIPGMAEAQDVGTSRLYIAVKDKKGNVSNPLSKTYTVHWFYFISPKKPPIVGLF